MIFRSCMLNYQRVLRVQFHVLNWANAKCSSWFPGQISERQVFNDCIFLFGKWTSRHTRAQHFPPYMIKHVVTPENIEIISLSQFLWDLTFLSFFWGANQYRPSQFRPFRSQGAELCAIKSRGTRLGSQWRCCDFLSFSDLGSNHSLPICNITTIMICQCAIARYVKLWIYLCMCVCKYIYIYVCVCV